ncbi:MAG: bifunctional riboflavin kinase/FAD synthetase [Raineya sp.]
MQIITSLREFPDLAYSVVSSGTFDGVHRGHKKILSRLVEVARQNAGQSVVITFSPHPRIFFGEKVHLLTSLDEKIQLLSQTGIDYLLILPFNQGLANLEAEDFVQKIYIEALQTKKLVIGYDHHFGKNRRGNFEFLQQHIQNYPFEIEEIAAQDIDDVTISSTKIRNALHRGDVKTANLYLGYAYRFSGKVVRGDQIGRTIGYPTANLQLLDPYKLIPAEGIYAVKVRLGQETFGAMLYIGNRPSLQNNEKRIEVNIFEFDRDIYNEILEVEFLDFIRKDAKLQGLEALKMRLEQDKIESLKILANLNE